MIQEDYVSFEIAKLLKEKGFDEPCDFIYDGDKLKWIHHNFISLDGKISTNSKFCDSGIISAPTLQMAMKWLREENGIYIDIFIDDDSEIPLTYNIHKKLINGTTECVYHHHENYYPLVGGYEKAVEVALKYSLENLI